MKSLVFSKTCRLCLSEKDNLLNIFDLPENDFAANIYYCVSLEVTKNDNLPNTACTDCVQYVINWTKFKNVCHESDKILREAFSADQIKDEDRVKSDNEQDFDGADDDFYDLSVKEEAKVSDSDDGDTFENDINCDNKNRGVDERPRKGRIVKNCETKRKRAPKNDKGVKKKYDDEPILSDDDDEDETIEEFLIKCEREDIIDAAIEHHVYVCEICSETQETMLDYLNHQETHEGQLVFKCDSCPEVFCHKNELLIHEGRHPVPCPQCEKMVLPKSLQVHMNMHTDRYKCPLCGLRFCNSAVLATHNLLIHTDIKEHVCETCGKRFSTKTALKLHHKSHSDIRAYPCKLCPYAGRTASGLYTHMSQHANENVVCEICAKIFKSRRRLNDHKWRIHNMHKKHECHCCNKKFADKYKLTVHMRTHTGAKPYQCRFCDRAFGRSEVMKQHMVKCELQQFSKLNVIVT